MPPVTFAQTAELEDAAGVVIERYEAGETYDLTPDRVGRWKRRGYLVDDEGVAAPAAIPLPPVEQSQAFEQHRISEGVTTNGPAPSGPLPGAGQAPLSSVSEAGQASTSPTLTDAEIAKLVGLPSTDESAKTEPAATSVASGPTSSTAPTPSGGDGRKGRQRSKG